jgi:hypothetical protein
MRLIPVAEMNYGHIINALIQVRTRGAAQKLQHATVFGMFFAILLYGAALTLMCCVPIGSLEGAVGMVIPLAEHAYDLLLQLQGKLEFMIPHCGGLNPKAYRSFAPRYISKRPKCRVLLDNELLEQYVEWLLLLLMLVLVCC